MYDCRSPGTMVTTTSIVAVPNGTGIEVIKRTCGFLPLSCSRLPVSETHTFMSTDRFHELYEPVPGSSSQ
jgi:hypothetical protein